MNEEKIIQYLKDADLWGKENLYTYTVAPPNFSGLENIYGMDAVWRIRYYIINKNEDGVAILPFDITAKIIKDLIIFIPNSDIKEVYTEKYKFMFFATGKRLVIKTKEDKVVEVEYTG